MERQDGMCPALAGPVNVEDCADRRHRDRKELRPGSVPAPGVPCLDADELAHGVISAGTEATTAIAARFGAEFLASDGSVDRKKLGPVVFADPAARRELEAIVHPAVHRAIAAGMRGFELLGDPLAIVDVPLLYETGAEKGFDRVIVTACTPERQLTRLVERGLTADAARQPPRRAMAHGTEDGPRRFRDHDRRNVRRDRPAGRRDLSRAQLDHETSKTIAVARNTGTDRVRPPLRPGPAPGRSSPRRTCSSRGSADTARAARCCDSGTACRRGDRDRRPRAA